MIIEKDIEIPEFKPRKPSTKNSKYQMDKMKVGHSFIYRGSLHGALSLMWQYRQKLGHQYVSAKTRYGNRRIWRVE